MNDLQLYDVYKSISLRPIGLKRWSRLYPEYVKLTGRACVAPHPHRHYTFEEFVDKLNEDPNFKNVILNKQVIKLWIARDIEDDKLHIFPGKPHFKLFWWNYRNQKIEINKNMFPEVTYENSPQQVEINLIK